MRKQLSNHSPLKQANSEIQSTELLKTMLENGENKNTNELQSQLLPRKQFLGHIVPSDKSSYFKKFAYNRESQKS